METLPVHISNAPTEYEREILGEIYQWRTRKAGWIGRAFGSVNRSLRSVTSLVSGVPGVAWTIDNVVTGLVRATNELMQDSLWRASIYKAYQKAGHAVEAVDDIRALELDVINKTLRGKDIKYRSVTAAQGAAAGFAGLAGVLPDVIALVALNLRAAGEYATYCGYDMRRAEERRFALQILYVASPPPECGEEEALVSLRGMPRSIAQQQTMQTIEQVAVSGSIRGIARALGIRLTQSKLAQLIPMAGALVGGGFNAFYTTRVCEAALHLYRERRLLEKYPPAVILRHYGLDH